MMEVTGHILKCAYASSQKLKFEHTSRKKNIDGSLGICLTTVEKDNRNCNKLTCDTVQDNILKERR